MSVSQGSERRCLWVNRLKAGDYVTHKSSGDVFKITMISDAGGYFLNAKGIPSRFAEYCDIVMNYRPSEIDEICSASEEKDETYEKGEAHQWVMETDKLMNQLFKIKDHKDLSDWGSAIRVHFKKDYKHPAISDLNKEDILIVKNFTKKLGDLTLKIEEVLLFTGNEDQLKERSALRRLHLLYIDLSRWYLE